MKDRIIIKALLFVIFVLISLSSCDRIKNKGKRIIHETEQKVTDKKDELVDDILPRFDSGTPDNKWNKKRFSEYLQVELTSDIHDILCFDDAIGIDASCRFSFSCDTSTVRRIVNKHRMKADSVSSRGLIGGYNSYWWQMQEISKLPSYTRKSLDERYIKNLWYNESEQKAYYLVYDL